MVGVYRRFVVILLLSISNCFATVRYVSLQGSHLTPYDTWANAATDIQSAVSASLSDDTIVVTNGTYDVGSVVINGATNRIAVTNGVVIRSVNGPAFTVIEGYTNGIRCIYLGENTQLEGFTLQLGGTVLTGDYINVCSGGGIWCESGAVISKCVIKNNLAYFGAGGIYGGAVYDSVVESNQLYHDSLYPWNAESNTCGYGGGAVSSCLVRCMINGNVAWKQGGGLYGCAAVDSTIIGNSVLAYNRGGMTYIGYGEGGGVYLCSLTNCILSHNEGLLAGGAAMKSSLYGCIVSSNSSNARYSHPSQSYYIGHGGGLSDCLAMECVVEGNESAYGAGVAYSELHNCLVRDNHADKYISGCYLVKHWLGEGGGAAWSRLVNCTVVGNHARDEAGGVLACTSINSIVCFNVSTNGAYNHVDSEFQYSFSEPVPSGDSNTGDASSVFSVSIPYLAPDSPCVNGGTNGVVSASLDLNGNPRIVNDVVDMGAYEYQGVGYGGPLAVAVSAEPDVVLLGNPLSFDINITGMPNQILFDLGNSYILTNRMPPSLYVYPTCGYIHRYGNRIQ